MVNPRYLHYRKYTPGPDPLAPPPDLTEAVLSLIHISEPTRPIG